MKKSSLSSFYDTDQSFRKEKTGTGKDSKIKRASSSAQGNAQAEIGVTRLKEREKDVSRTFPVKGTKRTSSQESDIALKEKPLKWKERRRDYSGLERLTKEIRYITAPILGARGFSGADILESWIDIVGPDLSLGIRPEKLTFEKDSRTHGTLHVKSAGGAFAMIFEHQKQRVIERINCFFGYPAVSRIKIAQGKLSLQKPQIQAKKRSVSKVEKEALQQKVQTIEDVNLREMTYQIGLSLLEQKK